MATRSSRAAQGSVNTLDLSFEGGLNYAQSETNIAENELARAYNYIYNSQTNRPEGRPGTTCVTAAALGSPIRKIYYYEKDASNKWLVCASGTKLYYLSTDAWVEIGSLTDATTVPSFITFNTKLLIADGGTNIRTWDGTTYTTIATSPSANLLTVIRNRVVANHVAEPDSVYLSAPNDQTDWNTSGSAVGLRAGYGDNMTVNGFGVFGDDLIVSKLGDSIKKIYRVNVASGTASDWYVSELTHGNCAQNGQCIISAFNAVYFVDSNGFKCVEGVDVYGDLQASLVGAKINTMFSTLSSCDELVYLPKFTAIWFLITERIFAYHRLADIDGNIHHAFTDLGFAQGRIRSMCQAGETVYLAGHNGYLYQIDDTVATDETAPGTTSNYQTVLKTKNFHLHPNVILRWSQIELFPLDAGAAILTAITPTAETSLKTITLPSSGDALYDATEELSGATDVIYDTGTTTWFEVSRNRVRGDALQFSFVTTSGRVGINGLVAELSIVGV